MPIMDGARPQSQPNESQKAEELPPSAVLEQALVDFESRLKTAGAFFEGELLVKDPYGVLDLQPGSDDRVVKKQFHKLSQLFHPDKAAAYNATLEQKLRMGEAFRLINSAHQFLSNAEKKARYDKWFAGGSFESSKPDTELTLEEQEKLFLAKSIQELDTILFSLHSRGVNKLSNSEAGTVHDTLVTLRLIVRLAEQGNFTAAKSQLSNLTEAFGIRDKLNRFIVIAESNNRARATEDQAPSPAYDPKTTVADQEKPPSVKELAREIEKLFEGAEDFTTILDGLTEFPKKGINSFRASFPNGEQITIDIKNLRGVIGQIAGSVEAGNIKDAKSRSRQLTTAFGIRDKILDLIKAKDTKKTWWPW